MTRIPNNTFLNAQPSLYVVATPIGNLSDMSARAEGVLTQVDGVLAEDTRHTGHLLRQFGIEQSLLSVHEHNERERVHLVLQRLEQGQHLALVSDAGTPAISDPGYVVIKAVREAGFTVTPIVGPCAIIAALSAAGLPTDAFIFDGFLPAKQQARQSKLSEYMNESRTVVLYESSHRIVAALKDLVEVLGDGRPIAVARELTKRFETIITNTAHEVLTAISGDSHQQKGEFVILIKGAEKLIEVNEQTILPVLTPLAKALPPKQAAALTSEITGCAKKEAYNLVLTLKQSGVL